MVTESDYMPYMEKKSSFAQKADESAVSGKITLQSKQNKDEGYGLSLQLGEDYERKKQKLKEELRLDYRRYVSEKHNVKATDPFSQPQTLSRMRRAAEVRLPDERIKDYSPLLRGDEEMRRIRTTSNASQTSGKEHSTSAASYHPSFSSKTQGRRSPERLHSSKQANLYEPVPVYEPSSLEDTHKDWHRMPRRVLSSTDEEPNSDEEEHEKQKRRPKYRTEPAQAGRRPRKLQHRADRFTPERRGVEEAATVNEEDHQEENRPTPPAPIKANPRAPTQSRGADMRNMTDFSTGLIIGASEQEDAVQRRKERYRQELLEQIAEQRRNKKKEKELELRVATTGAVDPEKEPDRINQFGAIRREHAGRRKDVPYNPALEPDTLRADIDKKLEAEREPPERPRVAFQSPLVEYSATLGHLGNTASTGVLNNGVAAYGEQFHKDFPGAIGGIVAPRVAGFPPPLAPTVAEAYSTPYDAAYYYYGARNPLDPNLAYYGPLAVHPSPYFPARTMPSAHQPPIGVFPHPASQHAISPTEIGNRAPPTVQSPLARDHVPSYKDSLKQQIEERQKRRTQEREEKERFEAKLEAEMKAYEPWGRGGAGAPLRDDQGNLICDLKHMHVTNKAAYVNPESCNRGTAASMDRAETTAKAEDLILINRVSDKDSSFTRPSPFARGNVFPEHMTLQQIREQERYKESLKQQIEEKQRMEAERRARLKLEEEKEEKRLAEDRARMQRQFEEEQKNERRKEMEKIAKKQEVIQQAEEQHKAAQKKRKEEEEKANEALKKQYEQEKHAWLEQKNFRSNSPPIPTIQKKLARQVPPRPPSVKSQQSATAVSVQSICTPQSPPVPARRNQIRAAEKQGVIRELSVMRELLRSEQKKLDGQLVKSDQEDTQTPLNSRARPHLNAFDMAMLRTQVPSSNNKSLKNQIGQDFNRLKYRDSDSREEVRQAYPERQQWRLKSKRRERDIDNFDLSSTMNPALCLKDSCVEEAERNTPLESESAFIDANGYSFSITPTPDRTSARQRRRRARMTDYSDGAETNSRERISNFHGSANSFHPDQVQEQSQRRMRVLAGMSMKDQRPEDDLWQRTLSSPFTGRVSTTAVTEAWLRPGTTETLKKLLAGRRSASHNLPRDEWDAPSACHG